MKPMTFQSDFLSVAPPAAEIHLPRLPSFCRLRLAEGLTVVMTENHTIPLVQLHAAVPAGAHFDPPGREGSASLLASALKEGTESRSAEQIYQAAEDLGADVLTWADWDMSSVVIELLSSDLTFAIELLFEMLGSPALPGKAVEGLQRRQLSRLTQQSFDPVEIANYWFTRAVYGETHYGHSLLGSRAGLQRINRETLFDFHRAHFGLPGMVLVASGSFSSEEFALSVEAASSGCLRREPPAPPSIEPPPLRSVEVYLLDMPSATQTEVRLGHLGVPRAHLEFALLQVLSAILGRRLKHKLREECGYTYDLRSRFVSRNCAGPFAITAGVSNEHVGMVVREIVREMERLQREPVSEGELHDAQNYLTGVYLRSFQPGHKLVAQLKLLAAQNLPDDHFARYLEQLRDANTWDITRLAQRYLHPQRMIVVAAGPAISLRQQLVDCGELIEIVPEGSVTPRD
jgi:zinc protease